MKLAEYLKLPGAKTLSELSDDSGVSLLTCKSVAKGMRLSNYTIAKNLSEACTVKGRRTGEILVTIDELCSEGN